MKTEYKHVRYEKDEDVNGYYGFLNHSDAKLDIAIGVIYKHEVLDNKFVLEGKDIIYIQESLDEISAFLEQLNKEKP